MPFLPEIGSLLDAADDLQLEVKQCLQTSQKTVTVLSGVPSHRWHCHGVFAEQESPRLKILGAAMLWGLPARMDLRLTGVKQQQTLMGTQSICKVHPFLTPWLAIFQQIHFISPGFPENFYHGHKREKFSSEQTGILSGFLGKMTPFSRHSLTVQLYQLIDLSVIMNSFESYAFTTNP